MNDLDTFKEAQRAVWAHFAPLQVQTTEPAARLVKWAGIGAHQRVLDVACGTGVVSVTAARAGAQVTGLDLTPELLQVARENARIADLPIAWHEGDAEALPFESGHFDVVVSQFGHIFAPRPDVVIGEMLRVVKPGGTIAFSTWPPELMMGRMFMIRSRYSAPTSAAVPPPHLWGDPAVVRDRLGDRVRDISFHRETMTVPALSPEHFCASQEQSSGAMIKIVETLSASDPEKLRSFRAEVVGLAKEYFEGNLVRQGYLMTRAITQ
jgi:SAM-dependent methyltransferase